MKTKILFLFLTFLFVIVIFSCKKDIPEPIIHGDSLKCEITEVQPMTGIVFFSSNSTCSIWNDVISLEFSYLNFNDIVTGEGVYDWTAAENLLNDIASRNHQAVLRFRYTYPGKETTVPDYIKNLPDYNETVGTSEGKETHFPDWTNQELKDFTLEFHTKFAEKYDKDPRLAFIEVGFGLWAEYHIYDGPFELGITFPSKGFQTEFFYHLGATYQTLYWLAGIESHDDVYSPIGSNPSIKDDNDFGLFDDSFMHKTHYAWNESLWNKFGRDRYKKAPCGGEFSYYSTFDQQHVLDLPDGPYGKSWEEFAELFHMTFILGNDQPRYQTRERIKQASMAAGYQFEIKKLELSDQNTIVEVENTGVAPIYCDAYITINNQRADMSLKLLMPGETETYTIDIVTKKPVLTIECDRLLPEQTIQYKANIEITTK
jgi:hypothetical protein